MWVGINVVEPHPRPERSDDPAEISDSGWRGPVLIGAFPVLQVRALGARILGHHQQLLNASVHQALRLRDDVARGPRDQVAAHGRNNTERTALVAAL